MVEAGTHDATLKPSQLAFRDYVVGQAQLGYKTYSCDPTDVILVTFPKSGSTWTSFNIFQINSKGQELYDNIKNLVIDITPGHWDPAINPFEIKQRYHPRTFKYHGMHDWAPKEGKFIYVARNPMDSLYSMYMFIHDLFGFSVNSEESAPIDWFYEEFFVKRFNSGHNIGNPWQHFLSWFPLAKKENMLWIHYEDLITDPHFCLNEIRKFMQVEISEDTFKTIVERSSVGFVKNLPRDLFSTDPEPYIQLTRSFSEHTQRYGSGSKIRKGVAGDGSLNLPREIIQDVQEKWAQLITPVFGYKTYEEMRAANSLLNRRDEK